MKKEEQMEVFDALYYERVSTTNEEQKESLINQRKLRDSYLERHPEIRCVGVYSEQVSGKSDNRVQYNAMLNRAKDPSIKYIMVKDSKRLFRSSEVAYQFRRIAQEYKLKIIYLSTGEIYDPNNESEGRSLLFGIEAAFDEQMVRRQSEYGRLAHRQKCESKRLNRNNVTFGYYWDEKEQNIRINEEEAKVIREMFNLYVFQDYGNKEIRKYLADQGYPRCRVSVCRYLQETAYIGIFHLNKKSSELRIGVGAKTKRFSNPKDQWIAVERPDLAIVDKQLFNLAQKMHDNRTCRYHKDKNGNVQGRFRGLHIFSSLIICAECGYTYNFAIVGKKEKKGYYRDTYIYKARDTSKRCINPYSRIYEEDLISITRKTINSLIRKNQECFSAILPVLRKVLSKNDEADQSKKDCIKKIKKLQKEQEKIRKSFIDATGVLKKDLSNDYEKVCLEIDKWDDRLKKIEEGEKEKIHLEEKLKKIENRISTLQGKGLYTVTRKTALIFIDKIIVHKSGVMEMILNNIGEERDVSQKDILEPIKEAEKIEFGNISPSILSIKNRISDQTKDKVDVFPVFAFDENYTQEKRYWNSVPRIFHVEVGIKM